MAEESGYTADPGAELSTLRHIANGRPRQIRYLAAEAVSGSFAPNTEVDRVLRLSPAAARSRLTQYRDRTLVDELLTVLRHAGPDRTL